MFAAYKKFAAGPMGLFAAFVGCTTAVVLGWRCYVSPVMKRRKRDLNEDFADYIFEERQKKLGENSQQ